MQTFLPFADFEASAKSLDKKRCWKQVVEAKQIINVLEGKSTAWQNHPAVKMWVGYTDLLKHYYNIFLHHCLEVHKVNTEMNFMNNNYSVQSPDFPGYLIVKESIRYPLTPFWLGNDDFHRAMRARLIEKDEAFYLPKFPDDKDFNGGKYFWPVMETKSFRII